MSLSGTITLQPVNSELNCATTRHSEVSIALHGHIYRPESTTAHLARLFEKQGSKALKALAGSFIVVVHDHSKRKVMIARDHLGERSLYYAPSAGRLFFSVNIDDLFRMSGLSRRLNKMAVPKYLSCAFLPDRETMFEKVYKLLPGEVLEIQKGRVTRSTYWAPSEHTPNRKSSPEQLARELRERIFSAVESRLKTATSSGVFLSGGLDSSLVASILAKVSSRKIPTYSLHFGWRHASENRYARMVARHAKTKHYRFKLTSGEYIRRMHEIISSCHEPLGDPITIPNYLLAEFASKHVSHVFNGEGGDPLFGGPKNIPMLLGNLYNTRTRADYYLRSYRKLYDELPAILEPDAYDLKKVERSLHKVVNPFFNNPKTRSYLNRLMLINTYIKGGHNILPKVEATYLANGVTPLSPLFDREIVEHSFQIPPDLKLAGRTEKYILKKAVDDLLPPEVTWREKSGMMVPMHQWLPGGMMNVAEDLLAPARLRSQGIFRPETLELLLQRLKHDNGAGNKLWLMINLQIWCDIHLGG